MALPGPLQGAIAAWLEGKGAEGRREASQALSRTYRAGGSSQGIDLAAYLVSRLPATYTAVSKVLAEVARLSPAFAPQSLLDAGAGPATASWAATATWESVETVTLFDNHAGLLELARALAAGSGDPLLGKAVRKLGSLPNLEGVAPADLVLCSYALAELPERLVAETARALWEKTRHTLVLVEPGTPAGFARIVAARQILLGEGAQMVGPCSHALACPVEKPDWCHFSVRLPRVRAHMHAKGAVVPFEDEKFAWLAVSRHAVALPAARVLSPPHETKPAITLRLCTQGRIEDRSVARREASAYKRARKLHWGDAITGEEA